MQTVELFCGTKSFSNVAAARGFKTFTLDIEPAFSPDLCSSILRVTPEQLPRHPVVLWASPPCQAFSVAALHHNWHRDGTPKHPRVFDALKVVRRTLRLIDEIRPDWWFIENPRGMLRKQSFMQGLDRRTVTYCQYGDMRQKPTDIWTNAHWWEPQASCVRGAACHVAAPRGSRAGTQGIKGARERSRIPARLFDEIFAQLLERYRSAA